MFCLIIISYPINTPIREMQPNQHLAHCPVVPYCYSASSFHKMHLISQLNQIPFLLVDSPIILRILYHNYLIPLCPFRHYILRIHVNVRIMFILVVHAISQIGITNFSSPAACLNNCCHRSLSIQVISVDSGNSVKEYKIPFEGHK